MTRTYTFAFDLEPEGGFTVTCPALPGIVTYGETLEWSKPGQWRRMRWMG